MRKLQKISPLEPLEIQSALAEMDSIISNSIEYTPKSHQAILLRRARKRLNLSQNLNQKDTYILTRYIDQLSETEKSAYHSLFKGKHLRSESIQKAVLNHLTNWDEPNGILWLADNIILPNQNNFTDERIFNFLSDLRLRLKNENNLFQSVIDHNKHFSNHQGQLNIFFFLLKKCSPLITIQKQIDTFLYLVNTLKVNKKSIMEHFEHFSEIIIEKQPRWKFLVLDSKTGPGKIASYMLDHYKDDNLQHYPTIEKIIAHILNLDFAFKRLSESVKERGEFWRKQLSHMTNVLEKSLSGNKIGLACYFGDYVVCEFGPGGNAAYIYIKDTFDQHIRDNQDWRRPELACQDFPRLAHDGRIIHNMRWQRVAKKLIKEMKRGSV